MRGGHVIGQPGGERAAYRAEIKRRAALGDDIADQLRAERGVGMQGDRAGLHAGLRGQGGFDFAELDAVAANLDLAIDAADELQRAIRAPANQIAGAIELALDIERVGHEAFGAQLGSVEIAPSDATPTHAQLAHHAPGQQRAGGRADEHMRVLDGVADGDGQGVGRQRMRNAIGGCESGALGGAITVDQGGLRQCFERTANVGDRQGFTPGEQVAQTGKPVGIVIDDGVEQRRRQPGAAHPVTRDAARDAGAGGNGLVMQHAAAAIEQRPPDFERGGIETQRRGVQHDGRGVERHKRGIDHQAQDGAVRNGDALGFSGGSGGVHHIGQRVGRARHVAAQLRRAGVAEQVLGIEGL